MSGGHLAAIAMKDLLEAGVHFGHQTKRWNPKMKEYIFGERNGIYIIDLGKTVKLFREAEEFVTNLAAEGRTILFVGTKRQAQDVIAEEAQRCGMFYVNERWLGGLLTNFATIQRSLGRLRDLETMATDGRYDTLSKKEIARNEKERRKLQKNLEGIRGMSRLPDAVFVVDTKKEKIAVDEARKLKIPVIGIVDTNCDPDEVDFVIPGNDDALRVDPAVRVAHRRRGHRGPRHEAVGRRRGRTRRLTRPAPAATIARRRRPDADAVRATRSGAGLRVDRRDGRPTIRAPASAGRRFFVQRSAVPDVTGLETTNHMATITAADVKKLRDQTGAGMMDCKAALEEANGDFEEATTILRKKGLASAAKKAGRATSEGLIGHRLSADHSQRHARRGELRVRLRRAHRRLPAAGQGRPRRDRAGRRRRHRRRG